MVAPWLKRPSSLPLAIAIMALLIIIVGGTVRVLEAGESCPDWPKCFGGWGFDVSEDEQLAWYESNPDEVDSRGIDHSYSTFEIFTEWLHRLIAALMAIPVLANFLIIRSRRERYGDGLVRTSFLTGILLIVQGIAGMVTVKQDNADWSVALHLILALFFVSILIWQWILMRRIEGKKWPMHEAPAGFVAKQLNRFITLTSTILILLILGAWVAANKEYNAGCAVGFPNGWPQCHGYWLPSLDGPGIMVQMFHRIGAGIVGIALIVGSMRIRESASEYGAHKGFSKCIDIATGFWLLNVFVGGLYIILAETEFPEFLSLIHLIVGVTSFLAAMFGTLMLMSADLVGDDDE